MAFRRDTPLSGVSSSSSLSLFSILLLLLLLPQMLQRHGVAGKEVEDRRDLPGWRSDRGRHAPWRTTGAVRTTLRQQVTDDDDNDGDSPWWNLKPFFANSRHLPKDHSSYLVLAPRLALPSSLYRVVVVILKGEGPVDVKAALSSPSGGQAADARSTIKPGHADTLLLQVPNSPGTAGDYVLRVEGHRGSKLLFRNATSVISSQRFLSILIQMSRPVYNGDQMVNFRVILLRTDLTPYEDPVHVHIKDANGYIVKRWVSRMPNAGVLSLDMQLPEFPVQGWWLIEVIAGTQKEQKQFLVYKYHEPHYEVQVLMPFYHLVREEAISGTLTGSYSNDKPIRGNATLRLLVKRPWTSPDTEFEIVTSQYINYMETEADFTFPMKKLREKLDSLEEAEVKVECDFWDTFTAVKMTGHSRTRLVQGQLQLRFPGSSPRVFKPGMPFSAMVVVTYEDLQPVDPEDLAKASLQITASVTLQAGGVCTTQIAVSRPVGHHMDQAFQREVPPSWHSGNSSRSWTETWPKEVGRGPSGFTYWSDCFGEHVLERIVEEANFKTFVETGTHRFSLDVPEDAASLRITATYSEGEEGQDGATAELVAHPFYSPARRYMHVSSSTHMATIGEFAVLHIKSNIMLDHFQYLILSKGLIVHSGREETSSSNSLTTLSTLSVPVSKEMVPRFTFIAFCVTSTGEVLADSIVIPVQSLQGMHVNVEVNGHKDHSKKSVEAVVQAPPGSLFGLTCQRSYNFYKQHSNMLTHARVLDVMHRLEPFPRSVHHLLYRSREGEFADVLKELEAPNYGQDVSQTFQHAAVVFLTDATFHTAPGTGRCDASRGFLECGDGSCYKHGDLCDGVPQCNDGSDELNCDGIYPDVTKAPGPFRRPGIHYDPLEMKTDSLFRLLRAGFIADSFDKDDGDWCNAQVWIGHQGEEELQLELAKVADEWVIEGFAVHPEHGFALTQHRVLYATDPPFYIMVEGPSVCRRGEQVSIRVMAYNMQDQDIMAMIILEDSEDYRFVHVESGGEVKNYNPKLSSGHHQHLVTILAGEAKEILLPIAVTLQSGTLEVRVKAVTQVVRDEETLEIEVKPEGVPVRKHTSLLVDLKNRAVVYEFLEVVVDQSPIITNSLLRRYVYGSPHAKVALSGDVFGPIMKEIAVDHQEVFQGRYLKSTDGLAFNFGATVWSLHYLRLTNQLKISEATEAFAFLNVQLSGLLTRYKGGAFKMWDVSQPTVWLTTWVVNVLLAAQHEDWENHLYIEPKLITETIQFILLHQRNDGSFDETQWYSNITLDHKMRFKDSRYKEERVSVALTALVTSVIQSSLEMLEGRTRGLAIRAKLDAVRYLERHLNRMYDPYDIAITAYCLTLTNSPEKETAVALLKGSKLEAEGMIYWSRYPITSNVRKWENNQRTFVLPKEPQHADSHAIEATSYALLAFLIRDGITQQQEKIVRWLNSVRDWDSAFMSTVDTVVALRALAEYSYRARLRDVTSMTVSIDSTSDPESFKQLSISNQSISTFHTMELPNVWGHINLVAKGAGQAVAQLDVSYGVDVLRYIEQPPRKYFDLTVREHYHQFRNKSIITTTVCAKWLGTSETLTSHAALVEVEVPTGYILYQPLADEVVRHTRDNSIFPQIRDAMSTETHIFWQFDHIPSDRMQCFKYELRRWFPTANMTSIRSATIMELFAQEHFETVMINATSLAALDICEVCGSYQCPYCPSYNGASTPRTKINLLLNAFVILLYLCFVYA